MVGFLERVDEILSIKTKGEDFGDDEGDVGINNIPKMSVTPGLNHNKMGKHKEDDNMGG